MLGAINAFVVAAMMAALIMLMLSFTAPDGIYSSMYFAIAGAISPSGCTAFVIICAALLGLIRFVRYQLQP